MTDLEKIKAYAEAVLTIPIPHLSNNQMQNRLACTRDDMSEELERLIDWMDYYQKAQNK